MTLRPRSLYSLPTLSILIIALSASALAPLASAADRISQFGITWTFDRDYPTGRFANGDHWVVGPVTIVSITPASAHHHGATMHGSMVNPSPNSVQGYDSRIKNNTYQPHANVAKSLPLVLRPGSSLLSSESHVRHATKDDPQLKTIAILTVLASPAPEGSFRPPYIGHDKALRWNTSQLRYDRLRSLPRVPGAESPDVVAKRFERPWIEQKTNWTGRYLHPSDNQPAYGRELAKELAQGLLTLQLDYSNQEKQRLLIALVQYGIDVYAAAAAGANWHHDGGHNQGRKMPLLLAGTLLDDPAILAFGDAKRHRIFQEDQQTWYVTAADIGRALFTDDRRQRDRYVADDIGIAEWGEKHAGDPKRDGRNWNAYYRTVTGGATIGHVLTARLMGLESAWNWPATFDYYDRYWKNEKSNVGHGANSIPPLVGALWSAYRTATPAVFTEANIATPIWQNIALPAQQGSFTVSFDIIASADKMDGVTGLSHGHARDFRDLAAAIRCAPSGYFDARDGSSYRAAKRLRYTPGMKYRVVMTIDTSARRYSVVVTPRGGSPVKVADSWRFRSEQSRAAVLSNLGFRSVTGYHAVLNIGSQSAALRDAPLTTRARSLATLMPHSPGMGVW